MSKPLVSVIVPIYGVEAYLEKCIKSILKQSFANFELILVDDGSPDNCPIICDNMAAKDQRVVVMHKKNGGLLSARKAGLEIAKGNYISFVDGDDWVDPFYLDTMVGYAIANKADLVVTGHFREFDGKIETVKPTNAGIYSRIDIEKDILPKAIYSGDFCEHGVSTYVWNKLFDKTLLRQILPHVPNDIVMGEDAAITYSYLAVTQKMVISKIPLYYYRQRHDSIVKSIEHFDKEFYRLGLLMNYLKKELSGVLEKENLDEQLSYYLYSQILVRTGGLVNQKFEGVSFNPFEGIERGGKVAVYSSGSFGQHLLNNNLKNDFFDIVAWVDIDYHNLQIGNNKVGPIGSLLQKNFDHVIIATIHPKAWQNITEELVLFGISPKKIATIKTDFVEIKDLLKALNFDETFTYMTVKIPQ